MVNGSISGCTQVIDMHIPREIWGVRRVNLYQCLLKSELVLFMCNVYYESK